MAPTAGNKTPQDEEKAPSSSIPQTKLQEESIRRGFLSFLVVFIPHLADAKKYDKPTKYLLTTIVALSSVAAPLGSNILLPVLLPIADSLHTSRSVVNLSIALYSLPVAFCPLWWSYLAETYGRRLVYLVSFLLLGAFNIAAAESVNIGMFIAMRLLAGGACASVQSVGAGTVADLWEPHERGKAMGIFFMGSMVGPLAAPVIGGALAIQWGWRATQWFQVIYGFSLLLIMLFFLPETSANLNNSKNTEKSEDPESAAQDSKTKRKITSIMKIIIVPIASVKLLRHMPIFLSIFYTSIIFGSYYLLNVSVQTVFSSPPYSWSTLIVGLTYIPSALGSILGSVIGGRWTDHIMKNAARKAGRIDGDGKLILLPEDRVGINALIAGIMFPGALLWWGWTADKQVFWIVPLIANFFYGFAAMLITNVTMTMLTEFVPRKSSYGVAVGNLVRNTFGCVAAVIVQPLIDAMGIGWLFTMAFFIGLGSGGSLILMKRNRERWSEEMKVAVAKMG